MIPVAMLNIPMFLNVEKQTLNPVWARWFSNIGEGAVSSAMDLAPGAQSSMIAISTASTTATTHDDSPLGDIMSAPASLSTGSSADNSTDPLGYIQPSALSTYNDTEADNSTDPLGYIQPSALSTYNDTEDALTLFWMGA